MPIPARLSFREIWGGFSIVERVRHEHNLDERRAEVGERKLPRKRPQLGRFAAQLSSLSLQTRLLAELRSSWHTNEALDIVCTNIDRAQDALGRTMLIENPPGYIDFPGADMTEWEFLDHVAARTGCGLLLDVNNVFVSATNHGFDPVAYLDGLPADRVRQVHLAGHSQGRDLLIDKHDTPICASVWDLYAHVLPRLGPVATMIERDDAIPPLADLLTELAIARSIGCPALNAAA